MDIVLNGDRKQAPDGCTLLTLLESLEIPADRVAIEHNGAIVKKTQWADTRVAAGDQLEIVHFVGGGRQ